MHLVCEEPVLPYHRPPLSKAFLKSDSAAPQMQRPATWLEENGITVHRHDAVLGIDRQRKTVALRSGGELPYGHLVLATGARPRELPGISPALSNVAVLRTHEDALRVRALMAGCTRLTIVGGGFIGLEVAATARSLGKQVCVLEGASRLLARAVSPEVSQHLLQAHRANGVDMRVGVRIDTPVALDGRLHSIQVDGEREPVDVLLLCVGAAPETSLASAAGLHCDNGVVVDEHLVSSDPSILAIGDCAAFPSTRDGQRLRLESVQNASDQARCAAATLLGERRAYGALPWFWSDQGGVKLQIAGLLPEGTQRHVRPGPNGTSFSVLHYIDCELAAVESINASQDHMAARQLMEKGLHPEPSQACDPLRALASFAAARPA